MGTLEELIERRPGIKLEPGDIITGTIVDTSSQQSNDFDTQAPAVWDDGKPKMLAVFVLRLDDSTEGPLYVQWWGSQKFNLDKGIGALRAQAGRGPRAGDRMRVQYVGAETDADRAERGVKRTPPIPAKKYRYDFQAGVHVEAPPADDGMPF